MSARARSTLISLAVFAAGVAIWFNAGVLRGIAHATKLPIEPLLEALLYLGFFGMLVGAAMLVVFFPRWNVERQR